MVARSAVVFPASMADILANPVEIRFGSFTTTSTVLAVATSPATAVKIVTAPAAAPVSDLTSETHPPKPYDIVQGMERVIDMMEETLQICKRGQRSMQIASRRKTSPFGLRPSIDVYARLATKSSQIQSGWRESYGDLKPELLARHDPFNILCTYHKGARHTLCGCRLRKKIDQGRTTPSTTRTPTSPDSGEF
jgi:hypothetical protein